MFLIRVEGNTTFKRPTVDEATHLKVTLFDKRLPSLDGRVYFLTMTDEMKDFFRHNLKNGSHFLTYRDIDLDYPVPAIIAGILKGELAHQWALLMRWNNWNEDQARNNDYYRSVTKELEDFCKNFPDCEPLFESHLKVIWKEFTIPLH